MVFINDFILSDLFAYISLTKQNIDRYRYERSNNGFVSPAMEFGNSICWWGLQLLICYHRLFHDLYNLFKAFQIQKSIQPDIENVLRRQKPEVNCSMHRKGHGVLLVTQNYHIILKVKLLPSAQSFSLIFQYQS